MSTPTPAVSLCVAVAAWWCTTVATAAMLVLIVQPDLPLRMPAPPETVRLAGAKIRDGLSHVEPCDIPCDVRLPSPCGPLCFPCLAQAFVFTSEGSQKGRGLRLKVHMSPQF